jgi:hypothetical protein
MSAPQLPAGLPPLPDGAVHLGRGGTFSAPFSFDGWCLLGGSVMTPAYWHQSDYNIGKHPGLHYAAPAGSEIARLNGHGAEPAKDSEAVALVRKLLDALEARHYERVYDYNDHTDLITEAAAFLAKEETKS